MENTARSEALSLLKEYNKSESLVHHALCVEAVMRHFASIYGGDADQWGLAGLLHDLDYERYPDDHCKKTAEILSSHAYPPEIIRAVMSHGWGICTDVEPQSDMEKVLFAVDELTGLVTATVYVRPSRSIMDLGVSSVKKKWKQKGFSAGVNRDLILKGAERLGMDIDRLIAETIEGMKTAAEETGLNG